MNDNISYINLIYDQIIHQTEEAVLLDFGDYKQWIPLSIINPEFLPLPEDGGEVSVQRWFVREKCLEDYEA